MQFWRWQHVLLLMVISAMALRASESLDAAVPARPNPSSNSIGAAEQQTIQTYVTYYSKKMATARNSRQRARAREHVLQILHEAAHPASAIFLNSYGVMVGQEFSPLLNNPKTALNAVITIAKINDISAQTALEDGLGNASPAVRYWAALGLGKILPQLAAIPPAFHQALRKLEGALKVEKDPIVEMNLCHALVQASPGVPNLFSTILHVLTQLTSTYAKQPPDTLPVCQRIVDDLATLATHGGALPRKQQVATLTKLAQIMSFIAQYNQAGLLSREQKLAAFDAISACGHAMDQVARTEDFSMAQFTNQSDPAAILLHVNHLTGSQNQPGKIQALFAKLPIPARIPSR